MAVSSCWPAVGEQGDHLRRAWFGLTQRRNKTTCSPGKASGAPVISRAKRRRLACGLATGTGEQFAFDHGVCVSRTNTPTRGAQGSPGFFLKVTSVSRTGRAR